MAAAWPWLLVAKIERRGFGVVFKSGLLGYAERMDVREEGKGKFVTLSLWVSGESSRFGADLEVEARMKSSALSPLTLKCL